MYNANVPTKMEVPSTAKLVKSTILAAATASVLLVTVVMPAEYGLDPTGVGNVLNLTKMGEIKMSLAAEAEADKVNALASQNAPIETLGVAVDAPAAGESAEAAAATALRTDELKVTLAQDEGTEVKATMLKGEKVNYVWFTDGGKANFDVHADSKELGIKYHGYEKGSATRKEGVIEAAFDGHHGWFWRNRTGQTLTVTLQTNGAYSAIKEMK